MPRNIAIATPDVVLRRPPAPQRISAGQIVGIDHAPVIERPFVIAPAAFAIVGRAEIPAGLANAFQPKARRRLGVRAPMGDRFRSLSTAGGGLERKERLVPEFVGYGSLDRFSTAVPAVETAAVCSIRARFRLVALCSGGTTGCTSGSGGGNAKSSSTQQPAVLDAGMQPAAGWRMPRIRALHARLRKPERVLGRLPGREEETGGRRVQAAVRGAGQCHWATRVAELPVDPRIRQQDQPPVPVLVLRTGERSPADLVRAALGAGASNRFNIDSRCRTESSSSSKAQLRRTIRSRLLRRARRLHKVQEEPCRSAGFRSRYRPDIGFDRSRCVESTIGRTVNWGTDSNRTRSSGKSVIDGNGRSISRGETGETGRRSVIRLRSAAAEAVAGSRISDRLLSGAGSGSEDRIRRPAQLRARRRATELGCGDDLRSASRPSFLRRSRNWSRARRIAAFGILDQLGGGL